MAAPVTSLGGSLAVAGTTLDPSDFDYEHIFHCQVTVGLTIVLRAEHETIVSMHGCAARGLLVGRRVGEP
jgi:hypothetical protein